MVMITSLFLAALAGVATAAPTSGYSSGSSMSAGSSGCGSSGCDSSSGMSSSMSFSMSSSMGSSDCGSSGCGSSSSMSSSSSDCGSSGCDSSMSSSMMMMDSSSTMMMDSTSTAMMMDTTSAAMMTSTMSADMSMTTSMASSYSMPSYGSGSSSSSSSSSGYDSCVQQCVAQYGMPSAVSMPPTSTTMGSSGSSGSGATHTVYVAPSQGVLRYVPFAVNASVGDTVKFIWGGGPHTVTKSSILDVCNKTDSAPFASGTQNASFVFTQVVNDTNATFFYCGVPTHCQKGMFGIINPPNALAQPSSVDNMMPSIAANNSGTAAAWASANNMTSSNSAAASWGGSIDMSNMPSWSQSLVADNVLYTRSFMAQNAEAINANGQLDFSMLSTGQMMVPPDVSLAAAGNSSSSSSAAGSTSASPSASSSASGSAAANAAASTSTSTSGAGALASPRAAVALIGLAAAFFAL